MLATISDKKIGVASVSNSSLIDHYLADVVSAQDYYPFGMLMPGRSYSGSSYRYGFNGKENDNEVKGEGNQQDYGMRIYDPRAGRFLSVDPITKDYPWLTPYQFASNRPIDGIDRDGLEWEEYGRPQAKIRDAEAKMTPAQAQVYEREGRRAGMMYMYVTFLLPADAATGFNGHRLFGSAIMTLSAMDVYEYTNRNAYEKDPNIRAENNGKVKQAGGDILIGAGLGKVFGVFAKTIKGLSSNLGGRFAGFNTRGLTVWEGEDAARYLKSNPAKAAYMADIDGEGTLVLGNNATRQEIVEELIHHQQNIKYANKYLVENRNLIELEAQEQLLKIGKREGWSKEAMEEIERAKKIYTEALKSEPKK